MPNIWHIVSSQKLTAIIIIVQYFLWLSGIGVTQTHSWKEPKHHLNWTSKIVSPCVCKQLGYYISSCSDAHLFIRTFIPNSKGKNDDGHLTDLLPCAKHVTKCFTFVTILNPHGPPGKDNHLSHFTAEEMEAERNWVTCLRSKWLSRRPRIWTQPVWCQATLLTNTPHCLQDHPGDSISFHSRLTKKSRGEGSCSDRYTDSWWTEGFIVRQERERDKKLKEKGFQSTVVQPQSL